MNGLEKINARIRQESQTQAEAILAEARQKCEAIKERWEAEAQQVYETRLNAGKQAIRAEADSADRIARLESKKELLQLKQDMVSEGFDKARDAISALPAQQYCAFLAKLAANAASGGETVILNEKDRAALGEQVVKAANEALEKAGKPAGLTLGETAGDFAGGLILRRGSVETNCTTELLVELCREDMAAKLAGILFD
ncbi:MAG: hypothetical protein II028_03630 [Clostridia bacterium]|jgi:Archaeal/vacuolar-type H+-ATPase subunit E|nr:hypothetical protein [Clostridia bacterium]